MRNRYFARSRPGSVGPVALEGAARDGDGVVDVLDVGAGDLGERLFGRRIERGEPLAAAWRDFLAANEQPVARLELDDVARFGRGCVLPRHPLAVAQAPAGGQSVPRPTSGDFGRGAIARVVDFAVRFLSAIACPDYIDNAFLSAQ